MSSPLIYSLDNYIQIQGIINNQSVNEGGYLIDINNASEDGTQYKGASINNEDYQQTPFNSLIASL